jgi:triacylglycerol lipase
MARRALVLGLAFVLGACGSTSGTTGDPSAVAPPSAAPQPAAPDGTKPAAPPASTTDTGPYPVLLLHGMAGFEKLKNIPVTYFNGVRDDLAAHGETSVYTTLAPPYDTSEERAKALQTQIDDILKLTGKSKVNLVGHSQGGIDARLLASPNGIGYGDRIASVTTVATPHRGSRVSDLALGLISGIPQSTVDAVTGALLGLMEKSVYDLQSDPHLRAQMNEISEAYMTGTFNPKYIDDPRVAYTSYGGRTNYESGADTCGAAAFPDDPTKIDVAQPLLAPSAIFLEDGTGRSNDGLVTVESARWGTFLSCVPADHLKEVGQLEMSGADPISQFDHLAFFRTVVARIRAAGF